MNFIDFLVEPYRFYSIFQIALESIATIFGLLSVYFSVRKHIWVYPTGIVSTVLYVYILFNFGLLGDMLINVYYSIMSIYGWILWRKYRVDTMHIQVSNATPKDWWFGTLLFLFSLGVVSGVYYFKPYIDSGSVEVNEPGFQALDWANYLDIFTSSLFLVGMWFMAKQKIENWLFWIVGDLICIPMMLYKGLGITSFQYFIFTILAILGYIEWLKDLKNKKTTNSIT